MFLKSGNHQDSESENFKILAVKKITNLALNFKILDFENFLFCEKVVLIDITWMDLHQMKTKHQSRNTLQLYKKWAVHK